MLMVSSKLASLGAFSSISPIPLSQIPVLLHAVGIDHVRPLETIVPAISRPERLISPDLRTIPLVGLTSPGSSDLSCWVPYGPTPLAPSTRRWFWPGTYDSLPFLGTARWCI